MRRDDACLHFGEWPGNGFRVKDEECERWVGEIEELVCVEVVDAYLSMLSAVDDWV